MKFHTYIRNINKISIFGHITWTDNEYCTDSFRSVFIFLIHNLFFLNLHFLATKTCFQFGPIFQFYFPLPFLN